MSVYRIYVEKKTPFAVEAAGVLSDIRNTLGIESVEGIRVINRYDVEDISAEDFEMAKLSIFSEPQVDDIYDVLPEFTANDRVFAVQYLPGQFDQRADSAAQCIQLAAQNQRPTVASAKVYVVSGNVSDEDFLKIKKNLINPVESCETTLDTLTTLHTPFDVPADVAVLEGFLELDEAGLKEFIKDYGLAMDLADITFCQKYFREDEKRCPSITEIRMIDTYWSDHCRHTTFSTIVENVNIDCDYIKDTYNEYLQLREKLYVGRNKPICLMDLATIGAKALKANGKLTDLDESEEINACSVKITVDVDGEDQDWLLMFKNETHNHPTEIEPFGGAATCLGGATRDPLSGRSYVYQAMRVTGAADPLTPFSETIPGKLPQKKIVTTAAAGYSSYGNQIGLATGQVNEVYHPGYVAKRMEIGAVIGAAPASHVVREVPADGDVIILLGGKTGRDGCGGATGSSKSHTTESLTSCGAEVQKGNAPEERKIQRLFRNPEVTRMIKRCNDFGAGGVSVAIGELADGLQIDLDMVPKKYDGLDGTELAISESQERMACVVRAEDADKFLALADKENLMATKVAVVTEDPRLVMYWRKKKIVDLSRAFLNSNGAAKYIDVNVAAPAKAGCCGLRELPMKERFMKTLSSLNVCSQKGLMERFDCTIGSGTVLMPHGGKNQLTPSQVMAAKVSLEKGNTNTVSLMSWGFNPNLSEQSPYHGAMCAVIESVAKIIAAGGSRSKCWLSFQEYFEKVGNDPSKWGKPFSALLGGLKAQLELGVGAIGGKDSMSGNFEELHVPPTLVSFAAAVTKLQNVVSNEFKAANHNVYLLLPEYDENGLPNFDSIRSVFDEMEALVKSGKLLSTYTLGMGGVAEAVCKMGFGNGIGFAFDNMPHGVMFKPVYGGFLFETAEPVETSAQILGHTTEEYSIKVDGETICMCEIQNAWEEKLEPVYPRKSATPKLFIPTFNYEAKSVAKSGIKLAQPKVLIPVFPGTNCEYDTARAFERAGAQANIVVIRNQNSEQIKESVELVKKMIAETNIIALPGGFSGGDEPDGSAKFITSFFRNPGITDAVHEFLNNKDGLMCGICNGFQALVKLGLVPFGEIRKPTADSPTLTYNLINRHQSSLVRTRIASNKSPWLMHNNVGDIHTIAISHGEGRFVISDELLEQLVANGQIATQYVDNDGNPTLDYRFNPNGSVAAIEGITSADGRVFGKMGHSERFDGDLYINVDGNKDQKMFLGAVDYFRD